MEVVLGGDADVDDDGGGSLKTIQPSRSEHNFSPNGKNTSS